MDVEVEVAAAVDEGGFGNFDFLRDKCKAPGSGRGTRQSWLCFDMIHSIRRLHLDFGLLSNAKLSCLRSYDRRRTIAKASEGKRHFFVVKGLDAKRRKPRAEGSAAGAGL